MLPQRYLNILLAALFLLTANAFPQNISSVAGGGGPNQVAAISAPIGWACGIAGDAAGNIYILDEYNAHIYQINPQGQLTTIAGNGSSVYAGDGSQAPATGFFPALSFHGCALVADSTGNLFFTTRIYSSSGYKVLEISAGTGKVETVAGNGQTGYTGDGGLAIDASIGSPVALAMDAAGNLFIADVQNNVVREVAAGTGIITTVAGDGIAGVAGGSNGDGGPATSAELVSPVSLAFDAAGNLYIGESKAVEEVPCASGSGCTPPTGEQAGYIYNRVSFGNYPFTTLVYVTADSAGNVYISDTNEQLVLESAVGQTNATVIAGGGQGPLGDGGPAISATLDEPTSLMLVDGNLYIADVNHYRLREITAGTIQTVAGDGIQSGWGDGGLATSAEVVIGGMAADTAGNWYIADPVDHRVREITGKNIIENFAGTGQAGYSGDGELASAAELNSPVAIAVDAHNNVYIADKNAAVVREVSATTGDIQTVAGMGMAGDTGDGGLATSAEVNPIDIAIDRSGNLFIADEADYVLREVTTDGIIHTVAGNGACCYSGDGGQATSAEIVPAGIAIDPYGNLYLSDDIDSVIREVPCITAASGCTPPLGMTAGNIYTVAGNGISGYSGDGGAATAAQMFEPSDVAADALGNVFIADPGNHLIREFKTGGTIQTIAGTPGVMGYSGDGGLATAATLSFPNTVSLTPWGNLLFYDEGNSRVRSLAGVDSPAMSLTPVTLSFNPQDVGTASTSQSVTATNTGGAYLVFAAIAASGDYSLGSNSTCSTSGAGLAPGATYTAIVLFTPANYGIRTGTLSFTDNAAGSPQTVSLTGTGQDFTLAIASNSSSTATVTPGGTADFSLNLAPAGGFNQTITFTCSGAPLRSTCTVSPSSATPDGTHPTSISVSVTTIAPSLLPPPLRVFPMPPVASWLFAGILFLCILAKIARRQPQLAPAVTLSLVLSMAILGVACGGGGSSARSSPGTPSGTYALTVTGTSGSLSHSQALSLTVN